MRRRTPTAGLALALFAAVTAALGGTPAAAAPVAASAVMSASAERETSVPETNRGVTAEQERGRRQVGAAQRG